MKPSFLFRFVLLSLICLWLTGCERGPDETQLQNQIQNRLETEFKLGLFDVLSLKRVGSAPSSDKITGDERLIIYYNTQLKFLEDYNLSSWGQLGIGSLSFLLGATENGVSGFHVGGNQKGDILQVYGTALYALRSGDWQPVNFSIANDDNGPAQAKAPKVKEILDSLNATYEANSARLGGKEIGILEKELSRAARKINRQLDVMENVYSIASGPEGGYYYEIAQTLEDHLRNKKVRANNYETEGSVENCSLVQNKAIDIAMTQSNVAALAYHGAGFFREKGAMPDLRAVASLYPEVVHIVVAKASGFESLLDLKAKRIDIGLPNSGTRIDALKVLDASGLKLSDFSAVTENALKDSIAALKTDKVDAFFFTTQAPAPALQTLAATYPIRFLPLDIEHFEKGDEKHSDYMSMTIPANTYPRQSLTIPTIGVTALFIANKELPDQRVWDLLDAMMRSLDALAEENVKAVFISRQTAQTGITLPLHPGAQAYFE